MSAPAVAVSEDGKKFAAAWMDMRTGKNKPNVYWSVSASSRFTSDQPVQDQPGAEQNHPSITIDASGTVWVTWEERRGGSQSIWVRSSAGGDGGSRLSDGSDASAAFPSIATGGGVIAVAYESVTRNQPTRIVLRSRTLAPRARARDPR